MFTPPLATPTDYLHVLRGPGHAVLSAASVAQRAGTSAAELSALAGEWSALPPDDHLRDGGRYRRRRIANFSAEPGVAGHVRGEHRPHFQAVVHNTLNGGVDRWFAAMEDDVAASAPLVALLDLGRSMAEALHGPQPCSSRRTSSASRPPPASPASRRRKACTMMAWIAC